MIANILKIVAVVLGAVIFLILTIVVIAMKDEAEAEEMERLANKITGYENKEKTQ